MPVKVGSRTFAYNDISGIQEAIMSLAAATGSEAVIERARGIACHTMLMNGKWFVSIDSEAFHAAFPGHNKSAYNSAKKKAQQRRDEIFYQICAERGLDEYGYPKKSTLAPTPAPTAKPTSAPTPKPTTAPAPKPSAQPSTAPATPKPSVAPSQRPESSPMPSKPAETVGQTEKNVQNEQTNNVLNKTNPVSESS